jgi:hypothetical protein
MAGNMATSGVSMVGQGASNMSFTPRAGGGAGAWMPIGSSGNLDTRTKDEVPYESFATLLLHTPLHDTAA